MGPIHVVTPGMRTIKTAISVVIGLYLSAFFHFDAPIFTTIACITAMQPSYAETFSTVKTRIFTCIIGIVLGYFLALIPASEMVKPLIMGFGILLTIITLQSFGMRKMISLSVIVFSASFLTKTDTFVYGINRLLGTVLGVFVSLAVNMLISSPKTQENLEDALENAYRYTLAMTKELLLSSHVPSLEPLKCEIERATGFLNLLEEEGNLPRHRGPISLKEKRTIITLFIGINMRLQLIEDMPREVHWLSHANEELLQKIFSASSIDLSSQADHRDLVYDYHVSTILKNILIIQDLLEKQKEE